MVRVRVRVILGLGLGVGGDTHACKAELAGMRFNEGGQGPS